jgi:hypothetical protein
LSGGTAGSLTPIVPVLRTKIRTAPSSNTPLKVQRLTGGPHLGLYLLDVLRGLAASLYGLYPTHNGGFRRGIGHHDVPANRQK